MTAVYAIYGVVDFLTIREHLLQILMVRWGVLTPIAVLIALTPSGKLLARSFGLACLIGVVLSALSIVWMISVIPPGGPPYLVGVLVVFIFASCNLRMPFPAVAIGYSGVAATYVGVLCLNSKFSDTDRIAGAFFMISSVLVGIITNFVQERRVRLIWAQDRRRQHDAERIAELVIEATAADQSKLNFLSILNHELRTPLHQILGFSELAAKSRSDPSVGEAVDNIRTAATQLLSLVAKMLRYADATAGKLRYDIAWLPVRSLVELACDASARRAEEKSVAIDLAAIEPAQLHVDEAAVSYALGHLVENGIKASPDGATVAVTGGFNDEGGYVLEIIDSGPGMTAPEIARAMEPFAQLGDIRKRTNGGLGLGLTLAKKILTDLGMQLEIVSVPGAGLTARVMVSSRLVRTSPQSDRATLRL